MKEQLLFSTNAYRIIKKDVQGGNLSHAYLILCQDEKSLRFYLKGLAKLITCKNSDDFCNDCRACKLIDKGSHPDVSFYPEDSSTTKIVVDDVDDLIANSYVKPFEEEKRIFVIVNASQMNVQAQNKLLKTLEEPPQNVVILIGATAEFQLLSTVVSRVKKLEIPDFTDKQLFDAFIGEFPDADNLKTAIALCGGKAGNIEDIYHNDKTGEIRDFVIDALVNMKSSKDVLEYSSKITKDNVKEFMDVFEVVLRDVLAEKTGGKKSVLSDFEFARLKTFVEETKVGAILGTLDKINEINKNLFFNANVNMTADGLLFRLLEEKYKWQKL